MMKLQYRLMTTGSNSWGDWKDFTVSVSTMRADYFEVRQVRDYRKGVIIVAPAISVVKEYEILDGIVYVEHVEDVTREFLGCKVIYEDGDVSFNFIQKETLDRYTLKGE